MDWFQKSVNLKFRFIKAGYEDGLNEEVDDSGAYEERPSYVEWMRGRDEEAMKKGTRRW